MHVTADRQARRKHRQKANDAVLGSVVRQQLHRGRLRRKYSTCLVLVLAEESPNGLEHGVTRALRQAR